jgi:hypothetical protein
MMHDDSHPPDFGPGPSGSPRPAASSSSAQDRKRTKYVVGLNGDVITLADLPSPRTKRWVIRRKAEVVLAVHGGLLSLEDACRRYQLTPEEFRAWQEAIERHGLLGLRSTHLQDYRHGGKN